MVEIVKNILDGAKSVIFSDPYELYKKDKDILDKPFYFEGNNGKAVLLVHGWTTTPYELRRLGVYLNEKGYTVDAPMLLGHGTFPGELENLKWEDWFRGVENSYAQLKKDFSEVYVAGTSMGSSLAVLLAAKNKDVSGVVLMATPYELRSRKIMEVLGSFLLKLGKKYYSKSYPLKFRFSPMFITRMISYQSFPIKNVLEIFRLSDEVKKVASNVCQPALVIQSSQDHVVTKRSVEKLYRKLGSKNKKKIILEKAYHTFISDIKNEHIFEDIFNFLNSI